MISHAATAASSVVSICVGSVMGHLPVGGATLEFWKAPVMLL